MAACFMASQISPPVVMLRQTIPHPAAGSAPGARGKLAAAVFAPERPRDPLGRALHWCSTRAFGHLQFVVARPRNYRDVSPTSTSRSTDVHG